MATLADSLVSSSSRPLTLRMRPDLISRQHRYHGQAYWVVKEPVGLNYYRFHEEEYAILGMLDGQTSLDDIKDRFEREFAPQKIHLQDLQQFVGMLHRSGLIIADSPGQGWQLKKRRDDRQKRELLGKFSNVFAVRFRGIDPERLLTWLHQYTWWMFTPTAILCVLLMALAALSLVLVQFDVFRSRLPTFHEFFGPSNWFYLAIVMGVVKVLHEFGHGLSCKHYGGECHEMGAMLLVFTPCLYCNVSDSWMLPNKWQRVFIGAAGMYVEVTLASIATFLWWFSEPGLLNHICLSVMFVCSVSTIMFNGNPLLRFDGYYILMDILEIPNLRQKATEVLRRSLTHLCLGIEQPENPFLPQRNHFFFGLYTIAAVLYRWVVVFSILMFLNQVLEPYGLKILGQLVGAIGLFGLVLQPLWQLGKFFYMPGRMHQVKQWRLFSTIGVLAGVVLFVIYVPMPFYVSCPLTVEPRDAEPVYSKRDAILSEIKVSVGKEVAQGDLLVVLTNHELDYVRKQFEGRLDVVTARLESLRRRRTPEYDSELNELRQQQESLQQRLNETEQELANLQVRAPRAGIVMPAPPKPKGAAGGDLQGWSGSLLDPANRGAYVLGTDRICLVGDPDAMEVVLAIDQADIDFVKSDDPLDLQLDAFPGRTMKTTVEVVSKKPLTTVPAALSSQAGGALDTVTGENGEPEPLSTTYPARAHLPNSQREFVYGMRGRAKIYTGWQPLGRRIYRYVARTFHFEM